MKILELPFSSVNLAWNGVLSLAGGWFFLTVCEAFPLGDLRFRLPGIGAYMSVALETGNTEAVIWGIIAMTFLIISIDFFFWSPILGWISQFKIEEIPGASQSQPMVLLLVRESWLYNFGKNILRRRVLSLKKQKRKKSDLDQSIDTKFKAWAQTTFADPKVRFGFAILAWIFVFVFLIWGAVGLFKILIQVSRHSWIDLLLRTFFTTIRVFVATALAALWTIPLGIWVGLSSKRVRIAQPLIQILAAFPTPMIFPLVLAVLFWFGLTINTASIVLMMMAAQWYLLFNVLAGALRISKELDENLDLMGLSTIDKWKTLYLPTAFPALVTGLITATGGAWNASIVSEYLSYKSQVLVAEGIGSSISLATNRADFPVLAASLTLMVITVLGFNRFLWAKVFNYAQTHYRTD